MLILKNRVKAAFLLSRTKSKLNRVEKVKYKVETPTVSINCQCPVCGSRVTKVNSAVVGQELTMVVKCANIDCYREALVKMYYAPMTPQDSYKYQDDKVSA